MGKQKQEKVEPTEREAGFTTHANPWSSGAYPTSITLKMRGKQIYLASIPQNVPVSPFLQSRDVLEKKICKSWTIAEKILQVMIVSAEFDWRGEAQLGFYHYMNQMLGYGHVQQPIRYSNELANVYSVTFTLRKGATPLEIIYGAAVSLHGLNYNAQEVLQQGMEAGILNVGCRREDALENDNELYTCNFFNY